jgi:hypothetical protein
MKDEQVGLGTLPEHDDQHQNDPGCDGVDGTLVARRDDGSQAGAERSANHAAMLQEEGE